MRTAVQGAFRTDEGVGANLCYLPSSGAIAVVWCRVHVVIVGGGFGGLYAARALRDVDVEVTLLDRRNHHVFQTLLYQVATAALSPGEIASPIRWILRRQKNVEVLLAEVQRVEVERRVLMLDQGEM